MRGIDHQQADMYSYLSPEMRVSVNGGGRRGHFGGARVGHTASARWRRVDQQTIEPRRARVIQVYSSGK